MKMTILFSVHSSSHLLTFVILSLSLFAVSSANGNSRGRFSSILKTLNAPIGGASSRMNSGPSGLSDSLTGKSGGTFNSDVFSSSRSFGSSGDAMKLKGKSSKAKLAAAGLLGVPLMASMAAGAYALRHKSPEYQYGRVVSSYGDTADDSYYGNNYFGNDLLDTSSTVDNIDVPTSATSASADSSAGQVASDSSSSTRQVDNQQNRQQQSVTSQHEARQVAETTESTKSTVESTSKASEVPAKSTVAIESGELHDLFGSARRGQKEELQGDHSANPILQLSNREYAAFNYPSEYDRISSGQSTFGDIYFVAIIAGVGIASIFGVIGTGYCLYRINQHAKATADIEYPAYGVVGPITKDPPSTHSAYSSGNVSPTGDRKLAQTAQMYHYQHQKAAMMACASASASRSSSAVPGKRLTSTSEGDSEEEADEIGYIVYECPGLAPTGEMEVKNPLFHDDSAPASPAKGSTSFLPKTPEGKSKSDCAGKKTTVTDEEDLK